MPERDAENTSERRRRTLRPGAGACSAAALATLLLAACGDDGPARPGALEPTLANVWPSDDGRSWTYTLAVRGWDSDPPPLYDAPDAVPRLTLDDAEALLDTLGTGTGIETGDGILRLRFDGRLTTGSGVEGQNLQEEIFARDTLAVRAVPAGRLGAGAAFLARFLRARPDLQDAVAGALGAAGLSEGEPRLDQVSLDVPLLLHGGAWEKTAAHIGTYGDLDTLLAWKFLGPELAPGSEFVHQLVPSLADDAFLHGRVLSKSTLRTPIGTFENALECLYLVEFGVGEVRNPTMPTRYFRAYDFGTVTYVPAVGPVSCYERVLVFSGDQPTTGAGDQRLELIGAGAPSV
jgi:hypothetical protein